VKTKTEVFLKIPDNKSRLERFFSFKLKQGLDNEPSVYDKPGKILAVSDIEGNFQPFSRLLIKNNVIDKYFNWKFEDGHLVIVGDCFDRGEQVTECLWLIYMLEEKAKKKGGKVHFILGNHEIMNFNGDWRYVHPKYAEQIRSKKKHTALYDGNSELWRWLRTKNIIEKIGDILFVHGGIAQDLLDLNMPVEEINAQVRPYYTQANNLFIDPLLNLVFNSENSPFWYRGYYETGIDQKLIDATIFQFNVKTIVTGHTVIDHVAAFFEGKVFNIDTDHAAGNSQALLIRRDRFYRVDFTGKRERIK
jgi:hypothetical protein